MDEYYDRLYAFYPTRYYPITNDEQMEYYLSEYKQKKCGIFFGKDENESWEEHRKQWNKIQRSIV